MPVVNHPEPADDAPVDGNGELQNPDAIADSPAGASGFFASRSTLPRGFGDYVVPSDSPPPAYPLPASSPVSSPSEQPYQPVRPPMSRQAHSPHSAFAPTTPSTPFVEEGALTGPDDEVATPAAETVKPKLWQRKSVGRLVRLSAIASTLTGGWFFGILVANFLPGDVAEPPLQEAVLRRTSRLAQRFWHFRQLWHTPTETIQIAAVPLPETGPVLAPIELSPIERQPLIDELNAIETEMITLDRRLEALEKRLGKPAYQGSDLDNRVNALRAAIDPPARPQVTPAYTPKPRDPAATLLEVATLKIVLPADTLFAPGQANIKKADLLEQVLDQLVNYPDSTVVVRSHSDNQASAAQSREYTLEQANALSTYLRAALPSQHRWVTIGAGQSQPAADNETVDNNSAIHRQQNRRVEILVDTR
ncbi:MAG: OmpA family protein [Cyanobacteria bacterium J06597_16]